MVTAVVSNSAAGLSHPSDPSLKIQQVMLVTQQGSPASSSIASDSTGQYAFDLASLPQALTYAGPGGAVDTITAGPDSLGYSYRQAITYLNGNVIGISAWVKL